MRELAGGKGEVSTLFQGGDAKIPPGPEDWGRGAEAGGSVGAGGGCEERRTDGELGAGVGGRGAEGGRSGPVDPRRTATHVGVIWNGNMGGDRGMERGVATGRSSRVGQGVVARGGEGDR